MTALLAGATRLQYDAAGQSLQAVLHQGQAHTAQPLCPSADKHQHSHPKFLMPPVDVQENFASTLAYHKA